MRKEQNNGKKIFKTIEFKVDTSKKHMKKVNEYFKEINKIKVPYSGIELLRMIREKGKMPIIRS